MSNPKSKPGIIIRVIDLTDDLRELCPGLSTGGPFRVAVDTTRLGDKPGCRTSWLSVESDFLGDQPVADPLKDASELAAGCEVASVTLFLRRLKSRDALNKALVQLGAVSSTLAGVAGEGYAVVEIVLLFGIATPQDQPPSVLHGVLIGRRHDV